MSVLRKLVDLVDALITGRPPREIERQFGWLRGLGYGVQESGSRGMELYTTYASNHVMVRMKQDYHYGFVGVWLARAQAPGTDEVGPDVDLGRLLGQRAPDVRWDGDYDIDEPGAGEAKLAEAARLLREHCLDLVRGENLGALDATERVGRNRG